MGAPLIPIRSPQSWCIEPVPITLIFLLANALALDKNGNEAAVLHTHGVQAALQKRRSSQAFWRQQLQTGVRWDFCCVSVPVCMSVPFPARKFRRGRGLLQMKTSFKNKFWCSLLKALKISTETWPDFKEEQVEQSKCCYVTWTPCLLGNTLSWTIQWLHLDLQALVSWLVFVQTMGHGRPDKGAVKKDHNLLENCGCPGHTSSSWHLRIWKKVCSESLPNLANLGISFTVKEF